jgi:aspartyl/asparaginyl-tRNA synthetase
MFISGVENIRDSIPFPRYPGNCEFWWKKIEF